MQELLAKAFSCIQSEGNSAGRIGYEEFWEALAPISGMFVWMASSQEAFVCVRTVQNGFTMRISKRTSSFVWHFCVCGVSKRSLCVFACMRVCVRACAHGLLTMIVHARACLCLCSVSAARIEYLMTVCACEFAYVHACMSACSSMVSRKHRGLRFYASLRVVTLRV